MLPRILRMEAKLQKYEKKLAKSPYYAAAQIFNPECRTGHLKDTDTSEISAIGSERLFAVRKLWVRFGDSKAQSASSPAPASSTTYNTQSPHTFLDLPSSTFYQILLQQKMQYLRPRSQDEFEDYISEKGNPLLSGTTPISWWNDIVQRTRYPRLSQLATEVLSMPGMSDKAERVFSGSRRRIPWDRTMTKTETLEAAECAKDWSDQKILGISL